MHEYLFSKERSLKRIIFIESNWFAIYQASSINMNYWKSFVMKINARFVNHLFLISLCSLSKVYFSNASKSKNKPIHLLSPAPTFIHYHSASDLILQSCHTIVKECTVKYLIKEAPNFKIQMFLVSSCCCLYPRRWSQMLSREWRCSWISADRRYSNYIWVMNNLIAY